MRIRYALVLTIIAMGLWAFVRKSKDPADMEVLKPRITHLVKSQNSATHTPSAEVFPVLDKLHSEALQIGHIDADPEQTETRLQDWAKSLNHQELEQLEKAALDVNQPQDDRFLAVMLMSWSEKAQALENLKDIAIAEIDPFISPNRMGEFERILRMQAVDGILDLPLSSQHLETTLTAVASRASESSIVDRAQRALWSLRGQADKPETQDKKALEEVLEKNGKH